MIDVLEINAGLVELSVTDKLTGLKNRRYFQGKLDEQIMLLTPEDSDATLLKKADQALYASKENGRNRVTHIADLHE